MLLNYIGGAQDPGIKVRSYQSIIAMSTGSLKVFTTDVVLTVRTCLLATRYNCTPHVS